MTDRVVGSIVGGVVEKFESGDRLTFTVAAGQAATGGKMVEATTGQSFQCRTAQAGSLLPLGVALHDAAAAAKVTVATEGVWMLYAEGAITAGDLVECGASGDVRKLATTDDNSVSLDPRAIVGRALADIANDTTGPVRLGI